MVSDGTDLVAIKTEKEEESVAYYKPPPVLMPEDDEDEDETSQTELPQSVVYVFIHSSLTSSLR